MVRSNLLRLGLRLGATAIVFMAPLMTASRVIAADLDAPSSWLMARPIIPELPDDDGGNHSNNDDWENRRDRHDWDDRNWNDRNWDDRDWGDRRAREYCEDLDSRRDRQECREDWEDRQDDWERRRDHDNDRSIFEEIFGR